MGKRKSAGQPWVRCPALVLCGLQNRGGRDLLGAHQQHEGVQGVSPSHTTLLARYSVLYLPATGEWKRGRKVGQSALYHGLGKGTGELAGIQSQGRPPNSMVHTRTIPSVLPLALVGLPPRWKVGVFRGEGGGSDIEICRITFSKKRRDKVHFIPIRAA